MTSGHTAEWGVLLASNQRTKMVSENLTAENISHFIPMIEDTRIVSGRRCSVSRPLLGNYIPFIVDELWKSIRSIRGVVNILMSKDLDGGCGYPASVKQHEIDMLKAQCDVNDIMVEPKDQFMYGQRVSPRSGPFAYHVGRYEHKTRRGDTAMFLLFGRDQKVEFQAGELVAV